MQRLAPALREDGVSLDLISLIKTILAACKEISFRVSQGEMSGVLGSTLNENIQGETQKHIDIVSNQLLKEILLESGWVRALSSEEEDTSIPGEASGKYLVSFDPLDGSSNIDVDSLVGTIFSIHEARVGDDPNDPSIFMRRGREQVAAGYVLYGPSTMMALTTGKGTHFYTLDRTYGGFLQTQRNVSIPKQTSEFGLNMSNMRYWQPQMQEYIQDLLEGKNGPRGRDFNMRWIACMVGDVHRILSRGGIFSYPEDTKKADKPFKLRLMYEANPMAFLVEQAGGKATTGYENIMDIAPIDIHQRIPVILGSSDEVDECLSYYKKHQD